MNRAVSFSISLTAHGACVGLLLLTCKPAEERPLLIQPCRVTLFAPGHPAPSSPPKRPAAKSPTQRPTVKKPSPPARPKIVTQKITHRKPLPRVERFEDLERITKLEREKLRPVPREVSPNATRQNRASVSTPGGSSYDALIAGIIRSNWVRPSRAVVGEDPPAVSVAIQIALDGTITKNHVIRSSGIQSLDLSAVKAIERSNPLPVGLPSSLGCRYYDVTIVFRIADEA